MGSLKIEKKILFFSQVLFLSTEFAEMLTWPEICTKMTNLTSFEPDNINTLQRASVS